MNTKIFGTLIAVTFLLIIGIVLRYTQAADVSTSANVENTAPTVDTIRFSTTAYGTDNLSSSGILPNVGTDRTIHINGTITDLNGEDDIASSTINLVFHKTSATNTCTADKNDCYHITTCDTNYTDGDDTQISYNCEVPLAYWIDATDSSSIYASDNWTAYVTVEDIATTQGTLSATIEVNSLLALNLPDAIDYGTRSLSEQSSSTTNIETPLTQRGNTKADVQVKGGRMSCNVLGSLATSSQAWALTDTDYQNSTLLTSDFVATERNIDLRTDDNNELSANLYWNIAIPASGVKGTCTGSNTISILAVPVTVVVFTFAKVVGGESHTVALATDGSLWAWGYNADAQLGLGDTTSRSVPVKIGTDTDWVDVTAGHHHTIARKASGALYAWGDNAFGQLGLGDTTDRTVPTQVGTDTNWGIVSAGQNHTIARKTSGALYAWGRNQGGQLGLGDTTTRTSPTQIGSATDWTDITTGHDHSMALKSSGALYVWGLNEDGQLGMGNTTNLSSPTQLGTATDWSSITAGSFHSVARKTSGTLFAWGYNGFGQLGIGNFNFRLVPTQVGTDTDWQEVTTGYVSTFAIKTSGALYAWGNNINGQLGLGDETLRNSPNQVGTDTDWQSIAAGGFHTMAVKTSDILYMWGNNSEGQLGLGDALDRNVPTIVPAP